MRLENRHPLTRLAGLGLAAGTIALVPSLVAPASAVAAPRGGDVTIGQVDAMFGGRVASRSRLARDLPELNRQMRAAGITTPQRKAAFLTTLLHESALDPIADEAGASARYRGRGYIQLTGRWNYGAAGRAIGVDLRNSPGAAGSRTHSAAIAAWYWTEARPGTNRAADRFDMGRVSRNVGYAPSAREDAERCRDFKRAYKVLSGRKAPASVRCARH